VAAEPTVRNSAAVPVELTGLNDAVTFFGKPVAARLTAPLNPFRDAMFSVMEPLPPCGNESDAGKAEILKFGTTTTTLMGAV
jgi:hypothetical protein